MLDLDHDETKINDNSLSFVTLSSIMKRKQPGSMHLKKVEFMRLSDL